MQLYKLTVIASFAAVTTCRSEIVIGTSKYFEVGQINLLDDPPIPSLRFRHKLDIFIRAASTPKQFGILVGMNIRHSIWWNHMAAFFILDLSPGCVNRATNYLFFAWQLDVLHDKVLCRDHKRGTIIFNYNPFTSQAAVPWKRIKVFPGIMKHPFTMFSREYQENETMHCSSLDFDKVKDLGGYKIIIGGDPLNRIGLSPKTEPAAYEFQYTHFNLFDNIFRTLNANEKFNPDSSEFANQRTEDMRARPTCLKYLEDGDTPPSTTYPHAQGELASRLTQNMPFRNINTERDLVDWGIMKIYTGGAFNDFITHPVLTNRNVIEKNKSICLAMVKNDFSAAYIEYAAGSTLDVVKKYNLHMNSDEPLAILYVALATRLNFPLEERVNSIISRMVESCLVQPRDVMTSPIQLSNYHMDEEVNTDKVIKVLELHELKFAFVILGIGLVFATIVFIIELAIGYECTITCRRRHIRKLTCNPKIK